MRNALKIILKVGDISAYVHICTASRCTWYLERFEVLKFRLVAVTQVTATILKAVFQMRSAPMNDSGMKM